MNNDTRYLFSLHRFVNVCRKEMVENWKTYILRSVMVYGMLAIVFVWNGYYQYHNLEAGAVGMDPIWEFESRFFLWGLVIWGCISASFTMERMKSKTSRTVVLMTPATMFEKFFARWLVATCGFILVFLIAFKLADLTRVVFYLLAYPELHVVHSFPLWEFCCNTNCFYETIGSGPAVVGIFLSCYFSYSLSSCWVVRSGPKCTYQDFCGRCLHLRFIYPDSCIVPEGHSA